MIQPLARKVLYIGIDGCRPDALAKACTPILDRLIANGAFTDNALTCRHSNSGSCWASLLTGVWEERHGIFDNSCEGARIAAHPTIFSHLRSARENANAVAVVNWTTRHHPILEGVNHYRWQADDSGVLSVALDLLEREGPDLLFVLLNEVDHAGHEHGFHPDAAGYLAAIENADQRVGKLIDTLSKRASDVTEDWLVVIATDHGGKGYGHGGDSAEERQVFLLFYGTSVHVRYLPQETSVVDVAPTVLSHLAVPAITPSSLDGHALALS